MEITSEGRKRLEPFGHIAVHVGCLSVIKWHNNKIDVSKKKNGSPFLKKKKKNPANSI